MPNCFYCSISIRYIPYRCKYCGMVFCNKHRLPENHACPFDLRSKDFILESLKDPLYQDALDYMNKELTVAKIYDYVTDKQMTKSEAIDLLTYFLEVSDNVEIKKTAVMAFKVLELKDKKAFKALETYLLSEEDSNIKKVIAKIMVQIFPKKSRELLNWIKMHEKDFQ
ncbi:MAG: AN1-type zinc finger domain-containing protein [Promethearchaeota archaeon]